MHNIEQKGSVVFAIAGLTSTGKTRLGEQTVITLKSEYHASACFFSIGDIHRLLATQKMLMHDTHESAEELAEQTLEQTSIDVDENGRVHLVYNGIHTQQTYENGNQAAHVSRKTNVSKVVNDFILTRLQPELSEFEFIGFDGRERRGANILFKTQAPDETRVQIRRIEQPECAQLPNIQILSDIHSRDAMDMRFIKPLAEETFNVVSIIRTNASHEANNVLAHQTAGIIVDFAAGRLDACFGTIQIPDTR
jgi:cytidylate kinase